MDLWIRSQDRKRLGKIELIEYEKDDYGYYLFGWWDKYNGSRLATYKSEERALEVLDEIHSVLQEKYAVNLDYKTALQLCSSKEFIETLMWISIYEMPKEWLICIL